MSDLTTAETTTCETAAQARPGRARSEPVPPPLAATLLAEERLARLTRVNQDDLVEAFGLAGVPVLEALLRAVGHATARRFAATILEVDRAVGERGLQQGAEWGLAAFHTALRVSGREHAPHEGPVLFMANHPGMADTLALSAAIPRPGLRTIAARRPFLELLPNLSAPLIWVDEDAASNRGAIRAAAGHLRAGGAVLTFPGGAIEPDPAVRTGLEQRLAGWNRSGDLLARLAPGLRIVPVLVSGVISAQAAGHPLCRLRQTEEGRSLLGAMLQLAISRYRSVRATVQIGPSIDAGAVLDAGRSPTEAAAAAVGRMLQRLAR